MRLRQTILIAAKDLRQRIRDRSVIVFAILAPAGLATIFSLLLGNVTQFHADLAYADLDAGPQAAIFRSEVVASLVDAGVATVTDVDSTEAARAAVADGTVAAAFVIPAGFSTAVTSGAPATIEVIGARSSSLAVEISRSLAARYGDAIASVQLAVHVTAEARGAAGEPLTPDELVSIAEAAARAPAPIELVDDVATLRQLDAPAYFAAAMAILFLFFGAQYGILSLISERRAGTLARMLAGPVAPSTVLLGKLLGAFATGILAMTVLVVGTTLALGADWGHPLGVAALVVAGVIAALGVTAVVTSFTRTEDAAGGANAAVAITLGILGGTFSPAAQGPELMATLSLLTPHGWFLRGLGDLHGAGASPVDALPSVAVLLGIGILTGALGLARSRRLVIPR